MTEYGLQLFSLRDITPTSLEDGLRAAAEAGYKYVEFAGFFDHSAEDVKKMLDKYGLIASGTHTWPDAVKPENIEATIQYHKAIGCTNLIFPAYMNQDSEEALDGVIEIINYAQPILEAHGIRLGYHNHSGEFFTTPFGKCIFDELHSRTNISFEIDTFWAWNADRDPVALMEALHKEGRISVIHLKDGLHAVDGKRAVGKSVGMGDAPCKAVREAAIRLGLLMVVESEGLDPTGPEEVTRCMDYLRTLEN